MRDYEGMLHKSLKSNLPTRGNGQDAAAFEFQLRAVISNHAFIHMHLSLSALNWAEEALSKQLNLAVLVSSPPF